MSELVTPGCWYPRVPSEFFGRKIVVSLPDNHAPGYFWSRESEIEAMGYRRYIDGPDVGVYEEVAHAG